MKRLLFTDIDGTLIDHHTYSTKLSRKALDLLKSLNIPVILCSSKTFDEQLHLQNKLGIRFPFIVENGSAIIFPKGYFQNLERDFPVVAGSHSRFDLAKNGNKEIKLALQKINTLSGRNLFGYAACSEREISRFTGLKGKAVKRAKTRWFTETLFSEQPQAEDLRVLDEAGLCVSQGGRFLTVQDKEVDKGKAATLLASLYEQEWKVKPFTIGIGDSPNDKPFLKVVDQAFLVQRHDGTWSDMEIPALKKVAAIGPKGFLTFAQNMESLLA